jgi:predicted alpha/beta-hydrolase family hydrolase
VKITPLKLDISDSIGSVSAEVLQPNQPIPTITLAHGADAGMDNSFMVALAKTLVANNIASLRFNFPFIEQKKKRPDFPTVAHKTIESALNKAHELFPNVPVFASGKSFGGRMSSQYLSKNNIAFVNGIIFFGFPLHPAGKPSVERAEHVKDLEIPMLFLQGTRDALADLNLIKQVTSKLPKAELHLLQGADHSFVSGKQEAVAFLADTSKNWINNLLKL